METENKEKDVRENPDTLRVALRVCEMRSKRLGTEFTVGDIARLGIELLYQGELEILRAAEENLFFGVHEISS